MKIYKISLAVVIILGIIYYVLDRQLFYYGKNNLDIYNILPLKMKPVFRYDFEGGFAIEDNYGFYLISKGKHKYVGSDVEVNVKEVIKYRFDNQKLIAQIEDTTGSNYFIKFSKNENPHSKQDIATNVWNEAEKPKFDNDKWIKIKGNEKQIRKIELCRNCLLIVFTLLAVFVIFRTIKLVIK